MLTQFGRKRTGNALQVIVFMTDGVWTAGGDPTNTINELKNTDQVSLPFDSSALQ